MSTTDQSNIVTALRSARASGERPSASGADLQGANLQGADLWGANLQGADLWGADLQGANLQGADLQGANLQGANLWGANLQGANLWGADLQGANLHQDSVVRALGETPSGLALIQPTPEGWRMSVGCWRGTPDALRAMISKDQGWPEARGEQIVERRPFLENVLALADWHMGQHPKVIDELVAKWGTPDGDA